MLSANTRTRTRVHARSSESERVWRQVRDVVSSTGHARQRAHVVVVIVIVGCGIGCVNTATCC
jgi:hypothetical protein